MVVTMSLLSTAMAMGRRRFHGREGLLYIKNSRGGFMEKAAFEP